MATKDVRVPITIYTCGGFGGSKTEAKLDEFTANPLLLKFTEVGKRKPVISRGGGWTFVVRGHNLPDPPDALVDDGTGCRSSRYGCFDPRYTHEMNVFVEQFQPEQVLLDHRKDKATS